MEEVNKICEDVQLLADLIFTWDEILKILDIDLTKCSTNMRTKLNEAYQKGKLTRLVKLRKSLIQLAENGSHPALEKTFILFDKQNSADV